MHDLTWAAIISDKSFIYEEVNRINNHMNYPTCHPKSSLTKQSAETLNSSTYIPQEQQCKLQCPGIRIARVIIFH